METSDSGGWGIQPPPPAPLGPAHSDPVPLYLPPRSSHTHRLTAPDSAEVPPYTPFPDTQRKTHHSGLASAPLIHWGSILPPRRLRPYRHGPLSAAASCSSSSDFFPGPASRPSRAKSLSLPRLPSQVWEQALPLPQSSGSRRPRPCATLGPPLTKASPINPDRTLLKAPPPHVFQTTPHPIDTGRILPQVSSSILPLRPLLPWVQADAAALTAPPPPPGQRPRPPGPWPHLLLEEALAVAQAAQLALLLLVLQLFRGRLKVADEVLQAQDDALEG